MARTTIDIDASVLSELKRRQRREHKTLGVLVSELLARALADEAAAPPLAELQWVTQPMMAKVDLQDKDALAEVLDGP